MVCWLRLIYRCKAGSRLSVSVVILDTARSNTWKQKHLPFLDPYITEDAIVDHTQEHSSLVLVEIFLRLQCAIKSISGIELKIVNTNLCFVDVIVIPLIWPSNGHHDVVFTSVKTEIVDGWLEQVAILR